MSEDVIFVDSLPRSYNIDDEVEKIVDVIAVRKISTPLWKTIFLGLLAGMFVSLAGMFMTEMAGGIPLDTRTRFPVISKLITCLTFPIGIVFIVIFGGELFTGNSMIMIVGWADKKINVINLILNWIEVFFSNLFGVVACVYLFAYVTGIFESDPQHEFIVSLSEKKINTVWYRLLISAIPANVLVCLSFYLALSARDISSKIIGLYLPIATFAATGWEHVVANMFFLSCGWMYGANVTAVGFLKCMACCATGNIIGGALIVGASEYIISHFRNKNEQPI